MRNQKHKGVADDRKNVERQKCPAMSPKIDNYSARIGVERAEQRPERVVETNDKDTRAERLQVLRHEPHPEFFARGEDKNRNEQNDEVAVEGEESREALNAVHAKVCRNQPFCPSCCSGGLRPAGISAIVRDCRYSKALILADPAFAFRVERIVNDKFPRENFVIAQPERAETAGDPAQAFAGWMRIARVRIGSPHNFAEQKESWVGQLVFFQDGIERDVFAVMTELAIRHVENNSDVDLGPVRVVRQKNKFGFPVDKIFDQP